MEVVFLLFHWRQVTQSALTRHDYSQNDYPWPWRHRRWSRKFNVRFPYITKELVSSISNNLSTCITISLNSPVSWLAIDNEKMQYILKGSLVWSLESALYPWSAVCILPRSAVQFAVLHWPLCSGFTDRWGICDWGKWYFTSFISRAHLIVL